MPSSANNALLEFNIGQAGQIVSAEKYQNTQIWYQNSNKGQCNIKTFQLSIADLTVTLLEKQDMNSNIKWDIEHTQKKKKKVLGKKVLTTAMGF